MRRAWRSVASRPVVAIVAIATIAVGLGVNAAIFSLTREVLLQPLPYKNADRLVRVFETNRALGVDDAGVAPFRYVLWRPGADAFDEVALFRRVSFNVAMGADARQVEGFQIDDRFFPMLGVQPAIGRGFTTDDVRPGADTVAILTDGFWRRQFGADPAAVGRVITIDGVPCTVVGVLPSTFRIYHVLNQELEVFRPLVLDPSDRAHSLNAYATLKPGVSIETARRQLSALYVDLPGTDGMWTASAQRLSDSFANESRALLLALQWAVALVLLIACANLANLLLASSAGRRKELAVRQALGASPWRIARDLSGETLLMVAAGGALAIGVAFLLVRMLNATLSFEDINRLAPFRMDGWVLAFTGALTLAVAALVGLLPARAAVGPNQLDALKDSTHGVTTGLSNRRLRQALVVGEIALAVVLAASALALTRSAIGLQAVDRGLDTGGVMTAKVSFNSPPYADAGVLARTGSAIAARLAAAPGLAAAAIVNYPPLSQIRVGVPVDVEGQVGQTGDEPAAARFWVTSPGYFEAAGIRLKAGRDFTDADNVDAPGVAIVSERFARRYWQTTDVIGRHVTGKFSGSPAFWIPRARQGALTVVGVAADVREDPLDTAGLPQLYLPVRAEPDRGDHVDGARRGRTARGGRAPGDARGRARRRSAAPRHAGDNVRRHRARGFRASARNGVAARRVRRTRAAARDARRLRRHGAHDERAREGDRHPHRPRRLAGRRRAAGASARGRAGGDRRRDRDRVDPDRPALRARAAVRRRAVRSRHAAGRGGFARSPSRSPPRSSPPCARPRHPLRECDRDDAIECRPCVPSASMPGRRSASGPNTPRRRDTSGA